ncbi:MAG: UDP-glucose/GDP-mannose dehydrogenase family protein [Caldimonas sp.]
MRVTIIGTGYVGLVTGACLAEVGNDVFCLDLDERKVESLNAGRIPIYEPGLEEIVQRNRGAGRLTFSSDVAAGVRHGEVQFIAVGTPSGEDGSADLSHVLAAARNIGRHMDGFKVVVDKSTVPVGTADKVRAAIEGELATRCRDVGDGGGDGGKPPRASLTVLSNPEFLKEGAAVQDFMRPDRIVIGVDDDEPGRRGLQLMKTLYAPFNRHHERTLVMGVRSAEFTKYAANAMLATRISFMNEMANLADRVGADIESVRQGIGSDPRIGYDFLYAGTGYGGSCFPKDVKALRRTAEENGSEMRVLAAVEAVNDAQKRILVDKIVARFGERLEGRTFAVWGLAFKPNTDDMREAPSRVVVADLLARGAALRLFDPVALAEARSCLAADFRDRPRALARLTFCASQNEALQGADALVIVTEWKSFRSPDLTAIRTALKEPVVFDGRNLFEPSVMREAGLEYFAVGRTLPGTASPGRA